FLVETILFVCTTVGLVETTKHFSFLSRVISVVLVNTTHQIRIVWGEGALYLRVSQTELVELLRHVGAGVLEWNCVTMLVNRSKRLVNLNKGTVRQLLNNTGFNAVFQDLTVGTLQANAHSVSDPVCDWRQNHQANTANPSHRIQRDLEEVCNVVVTTGDGYQQEEGDSHSTDSGTNWNIAWTLQQVVVSVIAGHLLLNEWVCNQQHDHQSTQKCNPECRWDGVVTQVELPRWHDTSNTVSPQHVNIRLGTRGDLRRVVRPKVPNGVNRQQARHQSKNTSGHKTHANSLRCEDWKNTYTNHVVLSAARSRELGVLLEPDQKDVSCNQAKNDARQDQNVKDVEAVKHQVRWEVATENAPVQPGTNDWQTENDRGHNTQTNARQQVIWKGVAHEALDHAEENQRATNNPVSFTWTTESASEENAAHVRNHGHHEHQCSPVV